MTIPITYKLELDTARDGTFSQAIDDITQYWIGQAQWNNGMAGSYDEVAPPARLTVELSNRNGEFDREPISIELLNNGDFSTWTGGNPDAWTVVESVPNEVTQVSSSNLYGEGGTGSVNIRSGGFPAHMYQEILIPGKTYVCEYSLTAIALGFAFEGVRISSNYNANGSFLLPKPVVTGRYRYIFNAKGTRFTVGAFMGLFCNYTLDDMSVKQVGVYAMMNRGMQVRLRATYNGATTTLFQGRISQIQSSAGRNVEPTMSLTIEDAMLELLDAEYAPPLLTAPTVDVALQRMFDDAVIRWPYSGSFWLMGVQGNSELGVSTYLYDHDVTDFETGITTFEYLGDVEDRGDGISAQGYVRDVVAGEAGGRFWFDVRSNKFKFHNRDHDPLNDTVAAVYNESHFDSLTPKYGEDIINDLTLTYTSRDVGAAGSVLWTLKSVPFLLKNNTKRVFNARYFDASNEQLNVGARTTVTPVAGTDFIANLAIDGSGANHSDKITVSVDGSGNSAKVGVFNNSGLDLYITLLQIRGTPITYIEERYQAVAGDSIAANELYPKVIEVRALDNTSLAEQFGDYMVSKFKDPVFRFETVMFSSLNGDMMADASVNRVIGDKITITDASTHHSGSYIIVGEQHTLTLSGDQPRDVTWILKPAARESFWVLGIAGKSELDETTRLSF